MAMASLKVIKHSTMNKVDTAINFYVSEIVFFSLFKSGYTQSHCMRTCFRLILLVLLKINPL